MNDETDSDEYDNSQQAYGVNGTSDKLLIESLFETLVMLETQHQNLRHAMASDPLPDDGALIKLKHESDELRYEIEVLKEAVEGLAMRLK